MTCIYPYVCIALGMQLCLTIYVFLFVAGCRGKSDLLRQLGKASFDLTNHLYRTFTRLCIKDLGLYRHASTALLLHLRSVLLGLANQPVKVCITLVSASFIKVFNSWCFNIFHLDGTIRPNIDNRHKDRPSKICMIALRCLSFVGLFMCKPPWKHLLFAISFLCS